MALLQVLKFFPRYDADNSTVPRILQRLRPWVQMLLQLGVAGLHGLKLDADLIACPEVLGQLPLRHLELEIGRSSTAHVKDITAALSQCPTLEYLKITSQIHYHRPVGLPDVSLRKALNLKHIHLQACFPEGRQCLPPKCQLSLDHGSYPNSWDEKWQTEDGRELMDCISAMRLGYSYGNPWLSSTPSFKVLQYLELRCVTNFTDLARLENIPHVRLQLHGSQDIILHTSGSWQSLEVSSRQGGFEIGFADLDAFLRDNPKFLFKTVKVTKAWRKMSNALYAACERQGLRCFPYKLADGIYSKRLSSIKCVVDVDEWIDTHLVCYEDFWPDQSMQSCLALLAPPSIVVRVPSQRALPDIANISDPDIANVSDSESPLSLAADLEALSSHGAGHRGLAAAGHRKILGRLTWLAHRLNPIRRCTHGV